MIPIGGIQIVPGLAHPARIPLKTSMSEESSEASSRFSEGCESINVQGAEDSAQSQETAPTPKTVRSARSPSSQRSRVDGKGPGDIECKQEEGIMTCTKAIASLRIASEEPLGKMAGSIEQIQQHTLSHSPSIQHESSARGIQKYSSSEFRHSNPETGMSAPPQAPLFITGAAERSPGQQGQSKNPSGAATD